MTISEVYELMSSVLPTEEIDATIKVLAKEVGEELAIKYLVKWYNAKLPLIERFGGKTILSKNFRFELGEADRFESYKDLVKDREQEFLHNMSKELWDYPLILNMVDDFQETNRKTESQVAAIQYDKYRITRNGRRCIIRSGEKINRAYNKINALLKNKDFYNEYAKAYSIYEQTRSGEGVICLSIHPLDYLTMSDSNGSWRSCLSFNRDGEYRSGALELMISPSATISYACASDAANYSIPGCDVLWNSKIWRSIVHLDTDFAFFMRHYPSHSDANAKAAAELVEIVVDGSVTMPWTVRSGSVYMTTPTGEKKSTFVVNTDNMNMYNDFDSMRGRGSGDYLIVAKPDHVFPEKTNIKLGNYDDQLYCRRCRDQVRVSPRGMLCSCCRDD